MGCRHCRRAPATGSRGGPFRARTHAIRHFPANSVTLASSSLGSMSTQALARPLPARSNRVRDLIFVATSFVVFAAILQIWHFAARRLLGTTETAELVVAILFPIAALPMYTRLALGTGPMLVQTLALAVLAQAIPTRVPLLGLQVLVGGSGRRIARRRSTGPRVGRHGGHGGRVGVGARVSAPVGDRPADAGPRRRRDERRRRRCARRRIAPRAQPARRAHVRPRDAAHAHRGAELRLPAASPAHHPGAGHLSALDEPGDPERRRGAARSARMPSSPASARCTTTWARRLRPENFIENQQGEVREDRRSIEEIAQQPRAARLGRRRAHSQLRARRHHRAVRARAPRHVADAIAARAPGQRGSA